jgi:hypothetical protein
MKKKKRYCDDDRERIFNIYVETRRPQKSMAGHGKIARVAQNAQNHPEKTGRTYLTLRYLNVGRGGKGVVTGARCERRCECFRGSRTQKPFIFGASRSASSHEQIFTSTSSLCHNYTCIGTIHMCSFVLNENTTGTSCWQREWWTTLFTPPVSRWALFDR